MKNNSVIWMLACLMLMGACTRETNQPSILDSLDGTISFKAVNADKEDTRTIRQSNGAILWSPEESIHIFYGSASAKFTSTNMAPAATTTFNGTLPEIVYDGTTQFWALYPYSANNSFDGQYLTLSLPQHQNAVAGSFDRDLYPAVARTKDLELNFRNVCGGVRFSLNASGVTKVTFKGNQTETLAGTVKVGLDNSGIPYVSEVVAPQTELTLEAQNGSSFKSGEWYHLVAFPATLTLGYTITLTYEDHHKEIVKSDKSVTIKRSVFGSLTNLNDKVVKPEAVDLGLPSGIQWATFNVGATKPEEYGDYFAWGETEPKSDYSWATYKWCNGSNNTLTKYNNNSSYGIVDNKSEFKDYDYADDVARANWQGSWRIPTDAEWTELRNNCSWVWKNNFNGTGINGYLVTGPSNKSIFLSATGRMEGTVLYDAGTYSDYWSSTLNTSIPYNARSVYFFSYEVCRGENHRYIGRPVRPVFGDIVTVSSVQLDQTALSLQVGETATLTATVLPENAPDKAVTWSSSDASVAAVDDSGMVTAVKVGTATITVTTLDGGKTATCAVVVQAAGPEAVDLGLSVKWATFNVGATKPEEYGDYFAWGETEPKNNYSWSTYKWCNGSSTSLTRYCPEDKTSYWGGIGAPDGKTEFSDYDYDDDAARANWYGNWRTPTKNEWKELQDNCTWEWKSNYNGSYVSGYLVISKKIGFSNKMIFLPATGSMYNNSLFYLGSFGNYWSSSLDESSPQYPWSWHFNSDQVYSDHDVYLHYRYNGFSVRPVQGDPLLVTRVLLDRSSLTLYEGEKDLLNATVLPETALNKSITWSSSDASVAAVDDSGMVTAVKVGTATITVTTLDGGKTATCAVVVQPVEPEAVDLGLPSGLKWASFNVGATKPEEYGDYFAWGETEPKNDYSWATYLWCNGSSTTLTRYCPSIKTGYWGGPGSPDNKTEFKDYDYTDDAARANWHGSWRTPTDGEWTELRHNCSWVWKSNYYGTGINGYLVTGPSGKSIFLPAAGLRLSTNLYYVGSIGYYWSSSLDTGYPVRAGDVYFHSNEVGRFNDLRDYGYSVRAVTE